MEEKEIRELLARYLKGEIPEVPKHVLEDPKTKVILSNFLKSCKDEDKKPVDVDFNGDAYDFICKFMPEFKSLNYYFTRSHSNLTGVINCSIEVGLPTNMNPYEKIETLYKTGCFLEFDKINCSLGSYEIVNFRNIKINYVWFNRNQNKEELTS